MNRGWLTIGHYGEAPIRLHWSLPIGAVVLSRFQFVPGYWLGFVLLAHLLVKQLLKIPPPLAQFQRVLVTLLPKPSMPGLTRVSLGLENTEAEIDRLLEGLREIAQERRAPGRRGRTGPKVNVQQQLDASPRAAAQRIFWSRCSSHVEEGCHEG